MENFTTCYEVMGVSEKATQDEIKKRYKELFIELHPDKHEKDSPTVKELCKEKLEEIQEAYSILGSVTKRYDYDKQLAELRRQDQEGADAEARRIKAEADRIAAEEARRQAEEERRKREAAERAAREAAERLRREEEERRRRAEEARRRAEAVREAEARRIQAEADRIVAEEAKQRREEEKRRREEQERLRREEKERRRNKMLASFKAEADRIARQRRVVKTILALAASIAIVYLFPDLKKKYEEYQETRRAEEVARKKEMEKEKERYIARELNKNSKRNNIRNCLSGNQKSSESDFWTFSTVDRRLQLPAASNGKLIFCSEGDRYVGAITANPISGNKLVEFQMAVKWSSRYSNYWEIGIYDAITNKEIALRRSGYWSGGQYDSATQGAWKGKVDIDIEHGVVKFFEGEVLRKEVSFDNSTLNNYVVNIGVYGGMEGQTVNMIQLEITDFVIRPVRAE